MSSALPSALAAAVDVTSGITVAANEDDADGAVVPPCSTKDEGAYVGASGIGGVRSCLLWRAFADGA